MQAIVVDKDVRGTLLVGKVVLGLLSGARSWASIRKSAQMHLHVTSAMAAKNVDRTAKRLGYSLTGWELC